MLPETLFKIELQKSGIHVDDQMIKQLTPMYLRWQEYIRQTREIDVTLSTEPSCTIETEMGVRRACRTADHSAPPEGGTLEP